ncbi:MULTISPECIES: hypothetical protein [unclassified Streptomyces]|uniref:hypothetical protein n=1 Tax=unclassified Streptomyces TaxID=2593676 RepID=UPI00368AC701
MDVTLYCFGHGTRWELQMSPAEHRALIDQFIGVTLPSARNGNEPHLESADGTRE